MTLPPRFTPHLSLFHAKVCFVAGVGFFTDALEVLYIYHADKYCAKNVLDQTATIFSLLTLPRTCWGMFMVKVSTSKYHCLFDI